MASKFKGGNAKKIGRSLVRCARYKNEKRREKNKVRKIERHLRVHINDHASAKKVEELRTFINST